MTSALLFDCLHSFVKVLKNNGGRPILLLLDNCSAHGNVETILTLKDVKVAFLPSQTTSIIQLCELGIIASIKLCFRNFQLERALDLMDEDVADIYTVDILTAMKARKRIWGDLSPLIIKNCWRHRGLFVIYET